MGSGKEETGEATENTEQSLTEACLSSSLAISLPTPWQVPPQPAQIFISSPKPFKSPSCTPHPHYRAELRTSCPHRRPPRPPVSPRQHILSSPIPWVSAQFLTVPDTTQSTLGPGGIYTQQVGTGCEAGGYESRLGWA